MMPIATLIPAALQFADGFSIDTAFLIERLTKLATAIRSGQVDYSICLRMVNVDIDREFDLADGIRFHKLSPQQVVAKYPVNSQFTHDRKISPVYSRR